VMKLLSFLLLILMYNTFYSHSPKIYEGDRYESNTKYIKAHIILNKEDSLYVYNSWSHTGLNVIDSGTWRYRCDMLIFNSSKSYTRNTKSKKKVPKLRPALFTNSCFIFNGDSIIQESNYTNYVFKRVK
jgi:hypothetical protein